jgi:glyceraldehyde 3-phosphate dehydrogenase
MMNFQESSVKTNNLWVGVNGFGRIGRAFVRSTVLSKSLQVVAINDPKMNATSIAYALQNDSVYGKFPGVIKVSPDDSSISVSLDSDSKNLVTMIQIFQHYDSPDWSETGADYVIECSGTNLTMSSALSGHLRHSNVKKVIFSAPPKDSQVSQYIIGVNHQDYKANEKVISNSSCTTNCLAPLVEVIDKIFGIEEALFSTVHAITASQNCVDSAAKGSGNNVRLSRSAIQNIIPSTTGAAKSLSAVLPQMTEGKITGTSIRVPVVDVSLLELTVRFTNSCDIPSLGAAIKGAANSYGRGIIDVTTDFPVSSDFIGDSRSCIVDLNATTFLNDKFGKITCWYDNEMAYAHRLIELCMYVNEVDSRDEPVQMLTDL